ncbi:ABC transporter ATP-binding protein [Halorhabdus sp. BNX81]|uniref:ABC transporter ATP-binding protein n=1 Tax=Halorhabdus sp. BNX81 TaxID=2980181 RepID=UPI0023DD537D|nr:ABC transporter ATP-binding protein [Halorhabdus sp. BNX81]WEL21767.1 ABC-type multidrug transport system, ATPase component [Halorhabdus sp. BNX81]
MIDTATEPAVRVRNVRKTYSTASGTVTALDGVSFDIDAGTVVGILGPNGAGKTTLIKSMLNLVEPTAGQIEIYGIDVANGGSELYRTVSAMLEGARNIYWRLSLRENLYYFTSLQGIDPNSVTDDNLRIVESLGLTEKLDEPVNSLSRGMKQKAILACVLARRTELLFLDEPTLGLDVEASIALQRTLRKMTAERDKTVVLSSHDMDVIQELCDRVIVLCDGELIVDDSVSSLLKAFKTQSHRLRLAEPLPERRRRRIEGLSSNVSWTDNEYFELEATLEQPEDYYELLSILEDAGARIRLAETQTPDLEDVFLHVTNNTADPIEERAVRED